MTGVIFFIKRCCWFLWDNPRYLVMLLAAILLLVVGLQMKGCFKRTPKLNEAEIRRAQQAIADQDRSKMIEVLTASEVREKNIDANVANAKADTLNAIHESKIKYNDMTNDELAKELEARK